VLESNRVGLGNRTRYAASTRVSRGHPRLTLLQIVSTLTVIR